MLSLIILMAGDIIYQRTKDVLSKSVWVKGAVRRPDALFFIILSIGKFNPFDPVGSFEGLSKI